jgi:hypothetical protein
MVAVGPPSDSAPSHLAELPPPLAAFVLRLLARAPTGRPADAANALAELNTIRDGLRRQEADFRTTQRQWIWLAAGLAACLGVVATGWGIDRAAFARQASARAALLKQIRQTDEALTHGAADLEKAAKALELARAVNLDDDPRSDQEKKESLEKYQAAMNDYEKKKAEVNGSQRQRDALLNQLGALSGHD